MKTETEKAYAVSVGDKYAGIYKAVNAGKAKYTAYLNAQDCDLKIGFPDLSSRRAPEYDKYNIPKAGVAIEFVEHYRARV